MSQIVLVKDRVLTAIGLGESHFREFKSALHGPPGGKISRDRKEIAKDICVTLVGFCNADGGELLVGVEDEGTITGLPSDDGLSTYLSKCYKDGVHKDTPLQDVLQHVVELEGERILYFRVLKSSAYVHLTSDGRCLQRRDLETIPISVEEIQFTRQERRSQEYDRDFIDGAGADVLNSDLVGLVAEQVSKGMSRERCLQYLDLADFDSGIIRLRRAALLLFAKDPKRWHPRLQIRILKVSGTSVQSGANYNVVSDIYVDGNVTQLIEKAWDQLRPHLVQTRLSGKAKFETRFMYPELACREALINAIAHRDYSQEGRGIEIYVFDDRMEVLSPGALLSTVSINDLKKLTGAHQSRNAFTSRVLREMGYMREVGEGMRRIFELMESSELSEPDIKSDTESFTVTLNNRPLYKPEHLLWLESFAQFDLSREEKAIVVLGYGGKKISPNEIFDNLGIVDTEHYRKLIDSLQKKGIISGAFKKNRAQRIARAEGINIRDLPRYIIQIPNTNEHSLKEEQPSHTTPLQLEVNTAESLILPDENFDVDSRLYIGNIGRENKLSLLELMRVSQIDGKLIFPRRSFSGYAFLQLNSKNQAEAVMALLDGQELNGYQLKVSFAQPRTKISSKSK